MKRTPMPPPSKPMKRSRIKPRHPKVDLDFPKEVRHQIVARAGGYCEVCRDQVGWHVHHRLMRSHGGPGTVENGLLVCGPCHDRIHGNPRWAYEHGYLLRSMPYRCGLCQLPSLELRHADCEQEVWPS